MIQHQSKFLIFIFLFSLNSFSAIHSENEKLIQELTGQASKQSTINSTASNQTAGLSLPARHLQAGLKAFHNKNYILALKHYNTVILKYSKSQEVKSSYLAKAELYDEMGLKEQAQLNIRLAAQLGPNILK